MTGAPEKSPPQAPAPRSFGALDRAVLRQTARQNQAQHEGKNSVFRHLGMMGALGWLLVVPPLLMGFLGSWLDRMTGTGHLLTALLVVAGLALGCRLAWKRMHEDGVPS